MIRIEWIFQVGNQETIDRYPGLNEDMATVTTLLDTYAAGQISTKELQKGVARFEKASLAAFSLDAWEDLRKRFEPTDDPRLVEITRLFGEPDSPENRALILLQVWRLIIELAKFKIRDPFDEHDRAAWFTREQQLRELQGKHNGR